MKPKTLHAIVKYFYPVAAGIETNMLETYKAFVAKGWSVTVHTTVNTLTEQNVLSATDTVQGLAVKRYPWNWYGFAPEIPWETADVLALHNFNIVPHTWILLTAIFRKMLGKRVPTIMLTPHGGFTPDWEIFSKFVATAKKIYHYTVGTMLVNLSVDVVRAVSTWEQKEIVRHGVYANKVITITNGIEDEAFVDSEKKASSEIKKRVKSFGKYMIQIGRVYNIKNYETVIKAMTKLPNDLHYVIVGPVGDEQYKKGLEELIAQLGLTDRVIFAGVIRGIDKYYVIKHAELMVHMARWESFCNAVHEGMSQGKVVVVSDSFALPYLVKDKVNGFCLHYDDVENVAKTISHVLSNKTSKEIQTIGATNKKITAVQSWRDVGESVRNVLEEKIETHIIPTHFKFLARFSK